MNLIVKKKKSLMKNPRAMVASWIALFLLGCGAVSSTGGSFPIHAYPVIPKALSEPHEVWVPCSTLGAPKSAVIAQMICVDETDLLELQSFIRNLDSVVRRYEFATKRINKGN
jgi:hypothetical protein